MVFKMDRISMNCHVLNSLTDEFVMQNWLKFTYQTSHETYYLSGDMIAPNTGPSNKKN